MTHHALAALWVGFLTATAAATLMFAIVMVGVSVSENDPSEAGLGYVVGAIGVLIWTALSMLAGRAAFRASRNRRGLLSVLPAVCSAAWCAAAGIALPWSLDLLNQLFTTWPSSYGALWGVLATCVMTAGAIPIALVLLAAHLAGRLVRWRGSSNRDRSNGST